MMFQHLTTLLLASHFCTVSPPELVCPICSAGLAHTQISTGNNQSSGPVFGEFQGIRCVNHNFASQVVVASQTQRRLSRTALVAPQGRKDDLQIANHVRSERIAAQFADHFSALGNVSESVHRHFLVICRPLAELLVQLGRIASANRHLAAAETVIWLYTAI